MGRRQWTRWGVPDAALGTVLCAATLVSAAGPQKPAKGLAPPEARIPAEPLGFVPPSRFYMPYRVPAATLSFLDADHLLFTFHTAKLMHREPNDPDADQDQLIHALVLRIPSGKIEADTTWRMHDRGAYLWNLHDGYFLLRRRDTLYIGGKDLVIKPYLNAMGTLASVQLSPDASVLTVQFEKTVENHAEGDAPAHAPTLGDDAPHFLNKEKQYTLTVIDTRGRAIRRTGRIPHLVALPLLEGGYLGLEQAKGKQWRVDLLAFGGETHTITTVTSTCQPQLQPISEHAFLTLSCLPVSSDHLAQAFDLHGEKLWEQIWQSRFTWGTFRYSDTGNRFAYGSVEVNHELAALDPVDEGSVVGQPVGVFSIATGKLDTVLDASPILTAGDNFALSPDGDTLAILRGGAIELYKLPAVAPPGFTNAVAEGAKKLP